MTKIKTISLADVGKTFSLRFVPNIHKPSSPMAATSWSLSSHPGNIATSFFSYVMEDGVIVIYRFGSAINKMLNACRNGYYGTPDGRFIAPYEHDDFDAYYATDDMSHITLDSSQFEDQSYIDEKGIPQKLSKFEDAVLYEPNIPWSLTSGLILEFKVDSIMIPDWHNKPILKICGMRFTKGEPLYKEGDDKAAIIESYGQIMSLETAVEEYVAELKSKYPDVLFNEDAKAAKVKWFKDQMNNSKSTDDTIKN